jgi:hypothetical protein
MAKYPKQTKKIKLDLSEIPLSNRAAVKKEIGDFIVTEMLLSISEGKSPVSGRSGFKKLNKQYAKDEKGGDINPNLELEGDLLDALRAENRKGDEIEIGIFKSSEQGKADGHNNLSGKSKLPTRRFIPDEKESFKRNIMNGVKQIITDNKVQTRQDAEFDTTIRLEQEQTGIDLQSVLGRSFLDELFEG